MSKPQRANRQDQTPPVVREKLIRYVGLSDVRIIRKADWATIGVESEDVQWDRFNAWTLPASSLPQGVLEYCQHDPELVIVSE